MHAKNEGGGSSEEKVGKAESAGLGWRRKTGLDVVGGASGVVVEAQVACGKRGGSSIAWVFGGARCGDAGSDEEVGGKNGEDGKRDGGDENGIGADCG